MKNTQKTNYAPVIGLFGAGGSGKTETIAKMVANRQPNYSQIGVLAYTKEAVANMTGRLSKYFVDLNNVTVKTYHSFALAIIRKSDFGFIGIKKPLQLVPGSNGSMIAKIAKRHGIKEKAEIAALKDAYGRLLHRGISLKKVSKELSRDQKKVLKEVIESKKKTGKIDFDDIPYLFYRLMKNGLAKKLVRRTPLIIMDEFQDVTTVQWKALKIYIQSGGHFVGAGDPYQSLFRFAGASFNRSSQLANMEGFEQIVLSENYRLTKQILILSNQFQKQMRDKIPSFPEYECVPTKDGGSKPIVVLNPKRHRQVAGILEMIREHKMDGLSFNDILILVRFDRDATKLKKALHTEQWPYVSYLKKDSSSAIVSMIQALIKIHNGSARKKEWNMVLSEMRNIGPATIEEAIKILSKNKWNYKKVKGAGKILQSALQEIQELSDRLNQEKQDLSMDVAHLFSFLKAMKGFAHANENDPNVKAILAKGKTESINDFFTMDDGSYGHYETHGLPNPNEEYLSIANVHTIKGREFKVVIFLAPYPKAYEKHGTFKEKLGIVDEMMVLNTVITRSFEHLYLFFPTTLKTWMKRKPIKAPSDFVLGASPKSYELQTMEYEQD